MTTIYFLSIIFGAGFVQGLTGFGSVLISLPLLSFFYPLKTLIPLISLFALIINSMLMWDLRKVFSLKTILPLFIPTLIGLPIGVYLLKNISSFYLELSLGIILFTYALYGLFIKLPQVNLPSWCSCIAGFLAGILGGSLGTNGPPIIVYTSLLPLDKSKLKFALTGYFFFAGLGISSIHAYFGLITKDVIKLFSIGIIPLILGVISGIYFYKRLSTKKYKQLVFVLLLIISIVFNYKGIKYILFK
ncbi:sulfite exporter TauE/SafE family protein [Desulfonauticus submarinus]|uniref:Probable membrane transporter protein n=1 Tax=Desulfonauticus submarinus TaxID=206665 RepID=A0A1H0FP67_9BACT|nr:sulfite exporter TauE/SafE family protein [Desulfonauticus submarinus]SDN96463.1 hypothetical protein SAMN04488516_11342 [Desulfonauticus submarinus]